MYFWQNQHDTTPFFMKRRNSSCDLALRAQPHFKGIISRRDGITTGGGAGWHAAAAAAAAAAHRAIIPRQFTEGIVVLQGKLEGRSARRTWIQTEGRSAKTFPKNFLENGDDVFSSSPSCTVVNKGVSRVMVGVSNGGLRGASSKKLS